MYVHACSCKSSQHQCCAASAGSGTLVIPSIHATDAKRGAAVADDGIRIIAILDRKLVVVPAKRKRAKLDRQAARKQRAASSEHAARTHAAKPGSRSRVGVRDLLAGLDGALRVCADRGSERGALSSGASQGRHGCGSAWGVRGG